MPRKRCRGRQAGGGGAARRARKFPGPPRNLFSANRREPSRAIATVANRRELSQPSPQIAGSGRPPKGVYRRLSCWARKCATQYIGWHALRSVAEMGFCPVLSQGASPRGLVLGAPPGLRCAHLPPCPPLPGRPSKTVASYRNRRELSQPPRTVASCRSRRHKSRKGGNRRKASIDASPAGARKSRKG